MGERRRRDAKPLGRAREELLLGERDEIVEQASLDVAHVKTPSNRLAMHFSLTE